MGERISGDVWCITMLAKRADRLSRAHDDGGDDGVVVDVGGERKATIGDDADDDDDDDDLRPRLRVFANADGIPSITIASIAVSRNERGVSFKVVFAVLVGRCDARSSKMWCDKESVSVCPSVQ